MAESTKKMEAEKANRDIVEREEAAGNPNPNALLTPTPTHC